MTQDETVRNVSTTMYVHHPNVVERDLLDGILLFVVEGRDPQRVVGSGVDLWMMFEKANDFDSAVAAIAEIFHARDDEVGAALRPVFEGMVENELLVPV